MSEFKAQVDDFITVSEKRMNALMRQSVSDVIDIAQTRVDKGGRMRVDTGFLRASGQVSLNGIPTGPGRGERTEPESYQYDAGQVVTELSTVKFGATIFFGWVANYARYRELYDGFLENATSQWQSIVAKNVAKIRERITK